ncbi:MAG: aldo/keto reductase [Deltaproteobacteria bacterium]|nr:aldo/keto reductase [Deltaproteobacteria bacterium]
MQYRMLGSTGLRVSEIGFGCGNVGGLMVRESHDEQLDAVRHALDLGINYFDTARAYGEGKSETHLGRVLEEVGEDVVLSTKIRLEADALDDIAAAAAFEVEQGLARLGRPSVDLIQLHTRLAMKREDGRFAMTPGEVLGPGGVIEAFKRLRDQGRVGFFGFTGLGEVEAIHALVDSGEFHSFQAYYNLLNPSAGQPVPEGFSALDYGRVIDRAAARGMGVVVIRVLAAGVLSPTPESGGGTSREPLSAGSDYERDVARAHKLGFLQDHRLESLPQAAMRFALMKPEVSTVLVGFSNNAQIDEAVACSGAGPLPDAAMAGLREMWDSDFGDRS